MNTDQKMITLYRMHSRNKTFRLRNRHSHTNGDVRLTDVGNIRVTINRAVITEFVLDRASAALLAKRINQAIELWQGL